MSGDKLKQYEVDELSAYVEGRCGQRQARRIKQLIRTDPRWAKGYRWLRELDKALDAYTVPAVPEGLSERIIDAARAEERKIHTQARWRSVARLAASIATAAAVIFAIMVMELNPPPLPTPSGEVSKSTSAPPQAGQDKVNEILREVPSNDRFLVENLDFFRHYDVLVNFETIREIERLEEKESIGI